MTGNCGWERESADRRGTNGVGAPSRLSIPLVAALISLVGVGGVPGHAEEISRPGFCDPTDTAVNDGHGRDFDRVYTREKIPLSSGECRELATLLDDAEAFAARFPTVADATAAGWTPIAAYVPGQGIHFEAPWPGGGPFDPRRPRFLLYDGTEPDSRLAGMMFLQRGELPPAGFPGDNDHWHNHPSLCFNRPRTFVLGEHLSVDECAAQGGVTVDSSDLWMVHVWLPVYAGWEADDIFNRSHPAL